MHEGGLAHGLLDKALAQAAGRRLTRMVVRVGALSGVAPESLEMHIEASMAEHDLEGISVEVHTLPARLKCSCGAEFEANRLTDPCPKCGATEGRTILAGRECEIDSVEVA